MISVERTACERFQRVASAWLRSGEITRTNHLLSPLEELAGFNYGFVYLLDLDGASVKIGYSEHPARRIRELRAGFRYGDRLRLRSCFVGEPEEERALHRRFSHLRIEHERFLNTPAIEAEFTLARARVREKLRALHCCNTECPQIVRRLDLRMLSAWLRR
ncbi:MAG TPA: GIY-YIG nuclease family protein [Candidatus Acidoferrales bacterium]|nr:GIY-YIG nuclease family protein [Candidatus Acidoferrales bacterium]